MWEYKIDYATDYPMVDEKDQGWVNNSIYCLNENGKEGWELVQTFHNYGESHREHFTFIFKRQVTN